MTFDSLDKCVSFRKKDRQDNPNITRMSQNKITSMKTDGHQQTAATTVHEHANVL